MTTAKARLLNSINVSIAEQESRGYNMNTQSMIMVLNNVRDAMEIIPEQDAEKLEAVILEKENYKPEEDKYDFGPVIIYPSNFFAFCKDAGIEKPVVEEVEQLSAAWVD